MDYKKRAIALLEVKEIQKYQKSLFKNKILARENKISLMYVKTITFIIFMLKCQNCLKLKYNTVRGKETNPQSISCFISTANVAISEALPFIQHPLALNCFN